MSIAQRIDGIRGFWILSVAIIANLPNAFAGGEEDTLKIVIEAAFSESSNIVIRHLPNISIGSGLREKEDIRNQWKYKIDLRCAHSCADRDDSHIVKFLRSGIRQVNRCPIPMNSLITFESADGGTVLDVYIHQSGNCFEIGDTSYYASTTFEPLRKALLL